MIVSEQNITQNNNKKIINKQSIFQKKSKISFSNINNLQPDLNSFKGPTPILSLDCEMVNCKDELGNFVSEVARVSIVNYNGHVLMDEYIRPRRKVFDWLTWVSGIRPNMVKDKPTLDKIKDKIHSLLKNKKVIGHTIEQDFKCIEFQAQQHDYIDINKFKRFRNKNNQPISLKNLAQQYLQIEIQDGEHSSVDDARATMLLYKLFEKEIERENKFKNYNEVKNKMLIDIQKELLK